MEKMIARITELLAGRKLIIASSSEPYVHYYEEDEIKLRKGTGGVVTAMDPLLRATKGVWVANSTGNADREVVDKEGKVQMPPDEKLYALKRIFLSKQEQESFLSGVANGALWPLSHVAYVRPRFIQEEWNAFRGVNKKFAEAIAAEAKTGSSVVWIQDYHLVLCAKYLKELLPNVPVGFFWHIPWPNPQVFKICPWHVEILDAMLSNDLLGFHTRYYANNFLETLDQSLECRSDKPASKVFYKNKEIIVKTLPISIDFAGTRAIAEKIGEAEIRKIKKKYGLKKETVIVGVDRLDYTKGLPEKIKAIDIFLQKHPEYIEKLSFIQIASPTRIHLDEYKHYTEEVETLVEEVNWKHSTDNWRPITLDVRFAPVEEIYSLYKLADICLVTSLHDGMNLVSKEYVAANADHKGVLILSKFAGASEELEDALRINPYSVDEIVKAMETALKMPQEEREERMKRMEAEISAYHVFKWATDFLENITKISERQ